MSFNLQLASYMQVNLQTCNRQPPTVVQLASQLAQFQLAISQLAVSDCLWMCIKTELLTTVQEQHTVYSCCGKQHSTNIVYLVLDYLCQFSSYASLLNPLRIVLPSKIFSTNVLTTAFLRHIFLSFLLFLLFLTTYFYQLFNSKLFCSCFFSYIHLPLPSAVCFLTFLLFHHFLLFLLLLQSL